MAVGLKKCNTYDYDLVERKVRELFKLIGIADDFFYGKKVVIKPNLVAAVSPDTAIITHPTVTYACAKIAREGGGDVVIAESPGGLYTESALKNFYKVTKTSEAAQKAGVKLNYDTSYGPMNIENGVASRYFDVITPILDADIIVDVCKLKTHTLTLLSANVKNLFGVIPGILKTEQHARYKNQDDFKVALVDLAEALCKKKKVICVTDGIVGMEGNGPSGGRPREMGFLLASDNIFEADVVCAALVNQNEDGKETAKVKMLREAYRRGLCPEDVRGVDLRGDGYESFVCKDYLQPDTSLKKWFDRIPKWLSPKPQISDKCVGCGKCAEVCPAKTITVVPAGNNKKKAKIKYKECLHCFCCQELCPIHAVNVKKNFVYKILN